MAYTELFTGWRANWYWWKHVQSLTFEMSQSTISIANLRKENISWVQNLFFFSWRQFFKRKGKMLCDTKLHTLEERDLVSQIKWAYSYNCVPLVGNRTDKNVFVSGVGSVTGMVEEQVEAAKGRKGLKSYPLRINYRHLEKWPMIKIFLNELNLWICFVVCYLSIARKLIFWWIFKRSLGSLTKKYQ